MKAISLCLCMILFLCFSNSYAQDKTLKKQNSFKLQVSNIQNLTMVNNQFFLYSNDTTFLVDEKGSIKNKVKNGLRNKFYATNDNIYSIESKGKIRKSSEIVSDFSTKLAKDRKIAKFLSKSEDSFYSCFVDSVKLSYSNAIFKIKDSEYSRVMFLVGIPAGLYVENNFLWYLYHKSIPNSNGMLRKYDLKTGALLLEIEIPVIEPIGLTIESNLCHVYSNYSHEIVTLNLGGK